LAGRYRKRNNQSARNEMDFVRAEVSRLLEGGQVLECEKPSLCVNPLSVAFKFNWDGSIKKRLVIDFSRWVNRFVVLDRFKMARFQDAAFLNHRRGTIKAYLILARPIII
jgi:hypothetical protein